MKPQGAVLQSARLLAGPLCCAYDTVSLHRARLTVLAADSRMLMDAHWALGTHCNGGSEVLGCWLGHRLAQLDVETVARELRERGVETVDWWMKSSVGAISKSTAQDTDHPEPRLASGDQLPPEHANRGIAVAALMASRLSASLTRHGAFASQEAARDFVARVLQRLEMAYCWESSSSGCNSAGARPASLESPMRSMMT